MTAANPITPAVLAHLTVLEHLNTVDRATSAEIATATGKVPSNVKRDMPKLYAEGLIGLHPRLPEEEGPDQWFLTRAGGEALDAMARAADPGAAGGVPFALTSELKPNPKQPRKKFEQEPLERLADTIDEKGILQPLVVRPVGEDGLRVISAGERRWRAACIVNERRLARGDQSGPVRLPYIERDATPEEQAEEEAYAAYIAVVENGQREPLTTYEEALAYRAMIPALYPSARACGKATGVDGKTVSDRLKALEDLTDAQKAEWRDGKLTWREVRDIFRPPAPAEVDPNQMDLEELTGAKSAPGAPAAKIQYDEELLLIIAEAYERYLVNKGCHPHRARWVKVTDSYPSIIGPRLVRQGLGAIHQEPAKGPYGDSCTTWLEISAKAVEVMAERGLDRDLDKARALVSLKPLPPRTEGRDRYATKWLKWPEVDRLTIAAEETAEAEAKPETAEAAGAPALGNRERLVFLEATHKMVTQNVLTAGRAARVGAYWLDAACSNLTAAGLIRFVNSGGESGWHVMWGEKAYAWLRAAYPVAFTAQGDLQIPDEILFDARNRLGEYNEPDGYTTPWLNVEPMASAPQPAESPEADAEAVLADQDMTDDEDAFDELLTSLREEMGRTHGQPEHWTRQSAADLAAKAYQEILRGDALSAIAALVGVLEHSGDTVETARLLHAAGKKGDYRPEGKEPQAMLWRAANGVRDLMLQHYEVFNGLPDADIVYRDLSGALNDVSRAKRQDDEVLLVIRKGDVVEKHPGAATQHRILEAQGAIGGRILFKAQPMRGGKDFGSPGSLPLSDFTNFIRGGGR